MAGLLYCYFLTSYVKGHQSKGFQFTNLVLLNLIGLMHHFSTVPKNKQFLPLIRTRTCAYQAGKKCSFFGKFDVLCFPKTPIFRFGLLPYYRQVAPTKKVSEVEKWNNAVDGLYKFNSLIPYE